MAMTSSSRGLSWDRMRWFLTIYEPQRSPTKPLRWSRDSRYRAGTSRDGIKIKNPASHEQAAA
jgi:hypothetical protein